MSAPLIAAREALAKAIPCTSRCYPATNGGGHTGGCRANRMRIVHALLASDAIQTPAEFAAGLADATEQDRADVRRWLIEEADNRVRYFPQRRDGVDALIRALAAALAERPAS